MYRFSCIVSAYFDELIILDMFAIAKYNAYVTFMNISVLKAV